MYAHEQASAGRVCRCGAQRKNCHGQISVKALAAVRSCYWTLASEVRSHLLRSLYEAAQNEQRSTLDLDTDSSDAGSSDPLSSPAEAPQGARQPRIHWQLCGQRVCFANFAHLLGTTQKSISKAIRNEPDRRRLRGAQELSSQAQVVEFFFYELYMSAWDLGGCNVARCLLGGRSAGNAVGDALPVTSAAARVVAFCL